MAKKIGLTLAFTPAPLAPAAVDVRFGTSSRRLSLMLFFSCSFLASVVDVVVSGVRWDGGGHVASSKHCPSPVSSDT